MNEGRKRGKMGQAYLDDKLKSTFTGKDSDFEKKLSKHVSKLDDELDRIAIGKIPQTGDIIKVNGLEFEVVLSGNENFTATIRKPETR